jgi:membrane associated rhomboid family serine protease
MKFKIFGRSPTLALQALAAVLTFLVTFGWDRLTAEHAGLIVAFLTAVVGAVNAWAVVPRNPALFATAFGSGAALLTAYGLDFSQEQIGTANMALTAIMGFILLNYVTPAADPAVGGGVSAKDVPGAPAGLVHDAAQ